MIFGDNKIPLSEFVGQGYDEFGKFKGRYRVCKGSRASKKSKTAALWFISQMSKEQYSGANLLVVRKVFRTLKDSCFTELKWAINRLGVSPDWEIKESPLEMTRINTGQKIYFRGLDDPLKVTSITVEHGSLCWLWLEEAYEIMNENDFDMLDESIRGETEAGLFKQLTLTFNPWNEHHWIKKRFFDVEDDNVLAMTTNYTMNEWLDDADQKLFDDMRKNNPRRFRVAGLGDWGIVEGVIFENWREEAFNLADVQKISGVQSAFGLDFGYTNDPSALWCGMVDQKNKKIYVFDELYKKALSNEAIYTAIEIMGYRKERIRADSSEPKSIDRLRDLGMSNVRAARKGKDSINNGIDFIQDFEIIIHPKCVNFLTEISNYTWDVDKFGKRLNTPIDDFNHLMDAMRYALEDFSKGKSFSFD
jgi:phage terminase large subunit